MPIIKNKCRDCWKAAQVDHLGLCEKCASDPAIVNEKIHARQVTKEIREGLAGFYKELKQESRK
tara:strand:- start:1075 stop:1266 length:192 start_codon:yes stop_codon:yes gene_type:complete